MWDSVTGEERIDPQGLRKPVKPRPGYTGVFKGTPPPSPAPYQRPGGGQFGLGQAGGGMKPAPGVGFDPGVPRMPPVGDVPQASGGVVPPAGQPETNWDRMQRENPELARMIPGGGISGGQRVGPLGPPNLGQTPAASQVAPLGGMRRGGVDPREALLRQLMLG